MKKGKKTAFVLLALVLALTAVLAGCSGSSSGGGSGSGESSGNAAANAGKEGGEASGLKPVELVMVFAGPGEPRDFKEIEAAINKVTQAKINATVKLQMIGWAAWQQQTTLMLAGNEQVDLILSGLGTYSQTVARGQYLAMDDMLEMEGAGVKQALDDLDPAFLNAVKIGGNVYAVPSIRDLAANYGVTMRRDLVDKYNIDLDAIKTYDDLDAVFQTIKDNEPDMIPLVKYGNTIFDTHLNYYRDSLDDGFGTLPGLDNDLKVVNYFETPEYMDLLRIARRWYENGYVAKDIATSTETQYNLVKSGKAFAWLSHMKPGYQAQESKIVGMEMVSKELLPPTTATGNITSIMWSIARNSKDPQRAMMLLNLMYTDPELINLFDWGIEGKHYAKTDDPNVIDYPQGVDPANSGYNLNMGWMFGNQFLSYTWKGDSPTLWEELAEFNRVSKKSKALGFTYDSEPVKTEVAAVRNVFDQYYKALETGTVDPEVEHPKFIKAMKAAGIDKIIAEKQKQLDAWAAQQ
ncbi:ABC transporter substrate-binding protein [Paenibacillus arenilitoris]|uniref:ABC transporter substrate-binding protein n=1 Tax=Paenibacillus arenilitoris TaxID=2772299 RepID=A0A927H4X0_9BACL|nr:ABC transporter substrate-binding protein [Paenibacillus arenilitoris]MBD2866944.1 ABC transporter substrate-binding protein [Paenibacillus arenilitoris]